MIYRTYLYYYNFFLNYSTPSNLTNVWNFGVISFFFLLIQIVTGIGLSMYYIPNEQFAFVFAEFIMRDTYFGWYFRYAHANGASLFFFFVYLHFFRSLYYFSYVHPKTAVWNTGVIILILMIVIAFTGYVLPRGQMSFWACTVITNLVTVLPYFGIETSYTVWGSYGVSTTTLNRFYTAHFGLPFLLLLVMIAHFYYLHSVGSSNAARIFNTEDKKKFHPYYTWKDAFAVLYVIILYIGIVLITPNYLNHSDNYIPADPLVTPEHIVPEWYFLAFYAILRSIPNKAGGLVMLIICIALLLIFPSQVKLFYKSSLWHKARTEAFAVWSIDFFALVTRRTNPILMKYLFWFFVVDFVGLSFIGMKPIEKPYALLGFIFTFGWFFFFTANVYIHSYNLWVIRVKGIYLPHLLNLIKIIFIPITTIYEGLLNELYNLSPRVYTIYMLIIYSLKQVALHIYNTYWIIKWVVDNIKSFIDDINTWEDLYEKNQLKE